MGTPAPDAVKRLVDRFDQDRKVFLSPDYTEEQLRDAADGSPPTAYSFRLDSDSGPSAARSLSENLLANLI
jgi:hypothetical protein